MSRQKQDISKISFNIDNEQLRLLQQYAKDHRMTFTATMEYAIEIFLKQKENEFVKESDTKE